MALPTQTAADKAGISLIAVKNTEGLHGIQFGSVTMFQGTGSPHGEVTAPKGSLFIEKGAGKLYINTDGAKTWVVTGTQS